MQNQLTGKKLEARKTLVIIEKEHFLSLVWRTCNTDEGIWMILRNIRRRKRIIRKKKKILVALTNVFE